MGVLFLNNYLIAKSSVCRNFVSSVRTEALTAPPVLLVMASASDVITVSTYPSLFDIDLIIGVVSRF